MSLLVILGIWIVASFALTPLVGYFLSGRAAERKARKVIDVGVPTETQPRA